MTHEQQLSLLGRTRPNLPSCTHDFCGVQITTLPEYYLTEAEASILDACGTDIARRCCVQDGTLLLELGAGWVLAQDQVQPAC